MTFRAFSWLLMRGDMEDADMHSYVISCVSDKQVITLAEYAYEDMKELADESHDICEMALADAGNVCEELYNSGVLVTMNERVILPNGDIKATSMQLMAAADADVRVVETIFIP